MPMAATSTKSQLANILHELVISNNILFLQVLLGMTFGQLDAGNKVFTISANCETSLDVSVIPPLYNLQSIKKPHFMLTECNKYCSIFQ